MNAVSWGRVLCLSALVLLSGSVAQGADVEPLPLADSADAVAPFNAALRAGGPGLRYRVECAPGVAQAGVAVDAPGGVWDLARFALVRVPLHNPGETAIAVYCRVENPAADGLKRCCASRVVVLPGQRTVLRTRLVRTPLPAGEELRAVNETPEEVGLDIGTVDPRRIARIEVYVEQANNPRAFEIGSIEAAGDGRGPEAFFPFIDEFGQYRHREWPGKTHDVADLEARRKAEAYDLRTHPGPDDRNRYGGWTGGPQLEATGHFRCEKHEGKWWLVDPDGRLFFSVGAACVTWSNITLIEGNEKYFGDALPGRESEFAGYYAGWAPEIGEGYDFGSANVMRKYGEDWRREYLDVVHHRHRSWGLNTIANWSNGDVIAERKTPYVVNLAAAVGIQKGEFPNVDVPAFEANMHKQMRLAVERGYHDDPWCIGFFVDNELHWDGVTEAQAERYYKTIRDVLKEHAPDKLYLGCRYALWNPVILDVAAKYCDVLSFNLYWQPNDVAAFTPQTTRDVPCLIGEFHFAAPDRGLFHAADRKQKTQRERAAAYDAYVRGCLRNPHLVGCHWFQYPDEPATGRWFDEENGQIGFVDICDTPYPELVAAARMVAGDMYTYRLETSPDTMVREKRYTAREVDFRCDGLLDEWAGAVPMAINELKEGDELPDAEDFHGVAMVGWNSKEPHRIYCAATITDDSLQNIHPADERYWEDDSLEVMLDLLNDRRVRQWTLGADGEAMSAGATPENTEWCVLRAGNTYVFELAIDLSKAIPGFALEAGSAIGLTVNYNDCENETREHQLGWVGGFPWNPANLGEVRIEAGPAKP